jgi:hypothetical protein
MSSLGAMLVRHIERDGKVGLEYIVFECIVERYSSQDNIEVLGVRVRSSKFATFLTFHYNQRTQPDRLEETPHSRLDIRVSRRHSSHDKRIWIEDLVACRFCWALTSS